MACDARVGLKFFLLVVTFLSVFTMVNLVTSMRYLHALFRLSQPGVLALSRAAFLETATSPQHIRLQGDATKIALQPSAAAAVAAAVRPSPKLSQGSNAEPKASEKKAKNKDNKPPPGKRKKQEEEEVLEGTGRPLECKDCFRHDFNYVIQNESLCAVGKDDVIDLLVLVSTVHANVKARHAIRNSWMSVARGNRGNVRYAFLLGETFNDTVRQRLLNESRMHGDLLMEDFRDAYHNLTLKTMMAFKWASTFCSQAAIVMKTDDDMWVNIPSLLALLQVHHKRLQTNVGGSCSSSGKPIRDRRSKWYASRQSYPQDTYLGFCSGTGYVTSMAVVTRIYAVSPSVPFFHLEDVYVGLCARRLGLGLVTLPGFHRGGTSHKPCEIRSKKIVTSHRVPPDVMLRAWQSKCGNSTA